MTIDLHGSIDASSTESLDWKSLPWDHFRQEVRRLQMRIAKAIKEKRYRKAKALQWILTHSKAAKFLAVQRVTTNKGHRTPGIDKMVWRTDQQKLAAISLLANTGPRTAVVAKLRKFTTPVAVPLCSGRLASLITV